MIAGALNVVVSTQRVRACTGLHIIATDEQQVGYGRRGVRAHAVLGDTHRPQNAHTAGLSDHVRNLFQNVYGNPAYSRGKLHGERRETLFVFIQSVYPSLQERGVSHAVVQQILADRGKPNNVGSRCGAQE